MRELFFTLKRNYKKIFDEFRILIILIIVAFSIKSTLVEIYVVPTGSMENTILTGDMLIGNKFIYGMRTPTWLGIPYTRIGIDLPWFRLPAFKKVSSGDVTIFEFPRDPFQKYVKRCIGIGGDSIMINKGNIIVNNDSMHLPIEGKYVKGYMYDENKTEKIYSYFEGNRDNIKNFTVPFKGMNIKFDDVKDWQTIITLLVQDGNDVKLGSKTFIMEDPYEIARTHGFIKYKLLNLINSSRNALIKEQKDRSRFVNQLNNSYKLKNLINPWYINYGSENTEYLKNNITVNGQPLIELGEYNIKKNYYFFMGDNRDSSYDSRFWGFVPETQILGTPLYAIINLFKFKTRMKVVS